MIVSTAVVGRAGQEVAAQLELAEVSLGEDGELLQGVLGRALRRNMLALEVATQAHITVSLSIERRKLLNQLEISFD